MEGAGVAARGTIAADLGAWVCFEDECGRTMRPPTARMWGRRGATPVVWAPGRREGWASVAALACYRPGRRSRLIYRVHTYRRRKGEAAEARDQRRLLEQSVRQIVQKLSSYGAQRNLRLPARWISRTPVLPFLKKAESVGYRK